jgi:endonuclease/exonuclease/phosphatase (EEP) superfamily protein YafD
MSCSLREKNSTERGFSVAVEAFPAGEPALTQLPKGAVAAKLIVKQDTSIQADTLFAFILKRHTNKEAYDMQRPVSEAHWKLLQANVGNTVSAGLRTGVVNDAAAMQKVRVINRESYEIETTTANTHIESAKLFRIGPEEIATHRDGISITGLMPRILVATAYSQ